MSDKTVLDHVKQIDETTAKILTTLAKPENRGWRILEIAAAIAGALSILSIIDVIRAWLGG